MGTCVQKSKQQLLEGNIYKLMGKWEMWSLQAQRMNWFLNSELADMHYVYDAVDGNGWDEIQMYFKSFQADLNQTLLEQLHLKLWDKNFLRSHINQEHTTWILIIEEAVLWEFERKTHRSIQESEHILDISVSCAFFVRIG